MINKHIKSLLADNKRVIVPEFGGFVVKRSAAGDLISFNSFLKFNDGLLVGEVVKSEGVDEAHALRLISESVSSATAILDENGTYALDGLGFLVRDKKGNVRFVEELAETVASVAVAKKEKVVPTVAPVAEVPAEKVESADGEQKKSKKRLLWLLIIVLFLGIICYFLIFSSNDSSQVVSRHDQLVEQRADRVLGDAMADDVGFGQRVALFFKSLFGADEESVIDVVDEVETPVVYESVSVMEPNERDTVSGILVLGDIDISPKGKERYNVIVASFVESINAEEYQAMLRKDEYASEIFDRHNGFQAVSLGGYPSLDIALKVCGEKLEEIGDIWILVK